MINKGMLIVFIICILVVPTLICAAISEYLILQNIDSYKFITQTKNPVTKKIKQISGYRTWNSAGIIAATGHFTADHFDTTYETEYESDVSDLGVEVQVTQHAGADLDKWLLHEVEDGYRDPDVLEAILTEGTVLRLIDGNRVFNWGAGTYAWLSGNKIVIRIEYADLTGTKPEPLEVVKAYLQKFPSSITLTDTDAKSKAHSETWIKDEMDRRLWLCDKWFEQLQLGKADQKTVLEEVVKSMNIFLDYREKYYGVKAADDKNLLDGYLTQNDEAKIKTKLQEYKTWWSANKTGSLIGILSIYAHRAYNQASDVFKKLFSFLTSLWERLLAMFG